MKNKIENKKRKNENERKGKGIIDVSLSYPSFTTRRSCFAICVSKIVSTPPQNPLH
jgi:hypothetical protein